MNKITITVSEACAQYLSRVVQKSKVVHLKMQENLSSLLSEADSKEIARNLALLLELDGALFDALGN